MEIYINKRNLGEKLEKDCIINTRNFVISVGIFGKKGSWAKEKFM